MEEGVVQKKITCKCIENAHFVKLLLENKGADMQLEKLQPALPKMPQAEKSSHEEKKKVKLVDRVFQQLLPRE